LEREKKSLEKISKTWTKSNQQILQQFFFTIFVQLGLT
jgi:hypothetical protein